MAGFSQIDTGFSKDLVKDSLIKQAEEENVTTITSLPLEIKSPPPEPEVTDSQFADDDFSVFDDLAAIPEQALLGSARAIRNQGRFLKSGVDWLSENVEALSFASDFIDSLPDTPPIPDAPGPISGFVHEILRFATAAVLPAQKLKFLNTAARGIISGGIVGATAFEPEEKNIAAGIQDLAQDFDSLNNFFQSLPKTVQNVLKALPNTPEDSEAMARMKGFVAEAFAGVAFETVLGLARTFRAVSHAKKMTDARKGLDADAAMVRHDLMRSDPSILPGSPPVISLADLGKGILRGENLPPPLKPADAATIGLDVTKKTGLFTGADGRFAEVEQISRLVGNKIVKVDLARVGLDFKSVKDSKSLIEALKNSIKGIEAQILGKVPGKLSEKRAALSTFHKALKVAESGPESITTAFEASLKATNRTELDAFFFDIARAAHGNKVFELMTRTLAGNLEAGLALPRQLAIGSEIEALSRVVTSPIKDSLKHQFDLSSFGFGRNFNKDASDLLAKNAKYIDDFDSADLAVRLNTITSRKQFEKLTQQSSRSGKFDAFLEYYYNSILSSSVVPNFIGSHAFLVYQIPVRVLAGGFGVAGNIAKGKLDASPLLDSFAFAGGYIRSFINNFGTLARNLGRTATFREPRIPANLQKFEAFGQNSIKAETFQGAINAVDKTFRLATRDGISIKTPLEMLTNGTGRIVRVVQNLFASADEFNRRIAYDADRWSRGHRTLFKVEEPSPKRAGETMDAVAEHAPREGLDNSADEFGRFITFTRDAEYTAGLKEVLSEYPVGRLLVPFLRSQADMFSAAVANSPMAFMSPTFKNAMLAGGSQKQIALAQLSLGSALTIGVYEGWVAGKVTGDGPSDIQERNWLKKTGWKPLSLLVSGDSPSLWLLQAASGRDDLFERELVPPVYVSYRDMQPFSTWFSTVVNSLETIQSMGDPLEADSAYKMVYEDIASNVLDKNFMNGLLTIIGGFNGGRDAANILPNLMGSLAPAIYADMSAHQRGVSIDFKTVDPMATPEAQARQKFFQKFKFRFGFDEGALPNYDGLGQVGINPNTSFGSFLAMDVSGKMSRKYSDVYAHILNTRFFPSKLPPHISHKGAQVKLTMEQYGEYQKLLGEQKLGGKNIMDRLQVLVNTPFFIGAADGEEGLQRKILERYVNAYKQAAKKTLMVKNPDIIGRLQSEKLRQRKELTKQPTFDLQGGTTGDATTQNIMQMIGLGGQK